MVEEHKADQTKRKSLVLKSSPHQSPISALRINHFPFVSLFLTLVNRLPFSPTTYFRLVPNKAPEGIKSGFTGFM